MNVKKIAGINQNLTNIFKTSLPYQQIVGGKGTDDPNINFEKKMIVFFGSDMGIFVQSGVDPKNYIEKYNQCLDYIRRKFKEYDLYYKPHPADEKERSFLDLGKFKMVGEKTIAELFLWKNSSRIKAVFSIASFASANAYSMGLNAHIFYKHFSDILGQKFIGQLNDFFFEMPPSFFILDLNGDIVDNSRILKKNETLENDFREILNNHCGQVWFIVSATEYTVILIALASLIRRLDPTRKIGLIISRHRRWNIIDPNDYKSYFNEAIILPRVHYSLKPKKILIALKTAWQIKNFRISPDDILISASQVEFVENCFVSYHKKSLRIGLVMNRDFNMHYNPLSFIYTENNDFRFSKASWFYNKIFEPILGLNRSLFMFYAQGEGLYITRYQKPINEIFNRVYIMTNAT